MRRVGVLLVALMAVQRPDPAAPYRARVYAYRSGTPVSDGDLTLPIIDVEVLQEWTPVELEAGALLHTDIALRLGPSGRWPDARSHLDAATALLIAAVARDGGRIEYARRWQDTVAGLLEAAGSPTLAGELSARGQQLWPKSAVAATASGDVAKGLSLEIQAAVAGPLSGPAPTHAFLVPPDAISSLKSAAEFYGAALMRDPADARAALHLGRVLLLLGRDAEAAARLTPAASSSNPSIRYLALMFLGAIDERAGRIDTALERYRAAREAFPWGQSAPIALSHALMRAGDGDDAREALLDHFTATGGRICEPLWTYLADPATDPGPTLDELRAEVWR